MCATVTFISPSSFTFRHTVHTPQARYSIKPLQKIPVVFNDGKNEIRSAKWGLIPPFAQDEKFAKNCINARSEEIREKPSFRNAMKLNQRCIVPVDGYYEWQDTGHSKQPYYFYHSYKEQPLNLAGLYEYWVNPKTRDMEITATIITTAANPKLAEIHSRMPCIISFTEIYDWLKSGGIDINFWNEVTKPAHEDLINFHPVGSWVSRAGYDGPKCIEKIELKPNHKLFED